MILLKSTKKIFTNSIFFLMKSGEFFNVKNSNSNNVSVINTEINSAGTTIIGESGPNDVAIISK
ncbi:hypothetical protein COI98_01875 [Bacillus cereus]|uniref:Uncharacterized protein n=1 Tax=Bacillus cereus TaxID=1396 RepID=A0A9X7A1J6_BACCE|nr:hypothetical protein COI98_01875 [Bacillus cereus]